MIIGYFSFEIYLPYSHSLKEKRKCLSRLKERLKTKYNIAVAELDFQEKWQRSRIGLVTISNQKLVIDKIFQKIALDIEKNVDGEILNTEIQFF